MKLRSILAGAAGTGVGIALANRALAARATDFEPFLGGDQGTYHWRGFDVSYAEAGDPADPEVVLLHGIHAAASSHEWEAVFERLAADHHVIAPDLPGFGHSERPPLLYTATTYEAFVADAIRDLPDGPPLVVASSLTGSFAAVAAQDEALDELLLVTPTAETTGSRSAALRTLLRTPLIGQALFNLLVSKPSIRRFHAGHGYADPANLREAVLDYEWTTAHQPMARYAPASFVSGFLDPDLDLGAVLAELDVPITLVWGHDAELTPLAAGRDLAERADARLVVVDHARLLPHAEHPEAFADVMRERTGAAHAQ